MELSLCLLPLQYLVLSIDLSNDSISSLDRYFLAAAPINTISCLPPEHAVLNLFSFKAFCFLFAPLKV
jgi:hypothetical protein